MAAFRIAVIGGDGIGPEVIEQAIRAADVAGPASFLHARNPPDLSSQKADAPIGLPLAESIAR